MSGREEETEQGLVRQLTQFCGLFEKLERETARRHKLRLSDFRCLNEFRWEEPVPVRRLAQRLSLSRSRVSRILDRLEEHRLVRRAIDSVDRRGINVHATARGRRLLDEFYATLADAAPDGSSRFDEQATASASRLVERLCQDLSLRLQKQTTERIGRGAEVPHA